ncbi:MAG: ATP-binding protein [Bacteroidales bacterium]|nr:ATP-binding protein [Bacteroidales bacterium]
MDKKIIKREIEQELSILSEEFPVILVSGPRQSGKTTLVKTFFHDEPYYNLEDPDVRGIIEEDPRAFFNSNPDGAILDEIHKIPELLSYMQGIVDNAKTPGMFILTGSNQINIISNVTQSLAGRAAVLKLLPFTFAETLKYKTGYSSNEWIYKGFYPGLYSTNLRITTAYRNYFETYIERDIRQMINIQDISSFQKFIILTAGRIGQIFNASSLANEVGVSYKTIQNWMSILEASYVVFLLKPWHENISKRVIKSPKIYFYDVGLACFILGIHEESQLVRDPLRGNLFENMIISNIYKNFYNAGLTPQLFYYRDKTGLEVDLIIKHLGRITLIEIKSSETFHKDFIKGIKKVDTILNKNTTTSYVIYDGEFEQKSEDINIINYRNFKAVFLLQPPDNLY